MLANQKQHMQTKCVLRWVCGKAEKYRIRNVLIWKHVRVIY